MFEREELLDEFNDLLQRGRNSAEAINRLLTECTNQAEKNKLAELAEHAARHVSQLERLTELVQ